MAMKIEQEYLQALAGQRGNRQSKVSKFAPTVALSAILLSQHYIDVTELFTVYTDKYVSRLNPGYTQKTQKYVSKRKKNLKSDEEDAVGNQYVSLH